MNLSKASWRCKIPCRKIQAIRKIRASDTSKALLAAIVTFDQNEQVRTAAAHRLCAIVAPITSYINSCYTDSEEYTENNEYKFAFVEVLTGSIDDDASFFDIAMHADFGLTEKHPEYLKKTDGFSHTKRLKEHTMRREQLIYIAGDLHGDWDKLNWFLHTAIKQNRSIKERVCASSSLKISGPAMTSRMRLNHAEPHRHHGQ